MEATFATFAFTLAGIGISLRINSGGSTNCTSSSCAAAAPATAALFDAARREGLEVVVAAAVARGALIAVAGVDPEAAELTEVVDAVGVTVFEPAAGVPVPLRCRLVGIFSLVCVMVMDTFVAPLGTGIAGVQMPSTFALPFPFWACPLGARGRLVPALFALAALAADPTLPGDFPLTADEPADAIEVALFDAAATRESVASARVRGPDGVLTSNGSAGIAGLVEGICSSTEASSCASAAVMPVSGISSTSRMSASSIGIVNGAVGAEVTAAAASAGVFERNRVAKVSIFFDAPFLATTWGAVLTAVGFALVVAVAGGLEPTGFFPIGPPGVDVPAVATQSFDLACAAVCTVEVAASTPVPDTTLPAPCTTPVPLANRAAEGIITAAGRVRLQVVVVDCPAVCAVAGTTD